MNNAEPKTSRWPGRKVALFMFGATFVASTLAIALLWLNRDADVPTGWGERGAVLLIGLPFGLLGTLILACFPRHVVGWMFALGGMLAALQEFVLEYAFRGMVIAPGTLPAPMFAAWLSNWLWLLPCALLILNLYFFPDGKLPSPHWRMALLVSLVLIALQIAFTAFAPGPLRSSVRSLNNPLRLPISPEMSGVLNILLNMVSWFVLFAVGSLSLVVRYRQAHATQRQQIKWYVFAATLVALASPLAPIDNRILNLVFLAVLLFLPLAATLAILRYRLFDIDVIIRRTLVYGVLTALLVVLFFGSVFALQRLFVQLTGQQSEIALIASTLLIAVLALPLRNRIQALIDRRFYRRKYDARKTVEAFAARLQTETDVNTLSGDLQSAIREALQPASVKVWLVHTDQAQGQHSIQ